MSFGHGDHWYGFSSDQERCIEIINQTAIKGRSIAALPLPEGNGGSGDGDLLVMRTGGLGELQCMTVVSVDAAKGELDILSAYPFGAGGDAIEIALDRIEEMPNGIEARLSADLGDNTRIEFFDVLYARNKEEYSAGCTYDFKFSALALILRRGDEEPQRLRPFGIAPGEPGLVPYSQITAEARDTPDLFAFSSTIERVESLEFAGIHFYKIEAPLTTEDGLDATLYAARHVLRGGYVPRRGDPVAGVLWLHGYLAGTLPEDAPQRPN